MIEVKATPHTHRRVKMKNSIMYRKGFGIRRYSCPHSDERGMATEERVVDSVEVVPIVAVAVGGASPSSSVWVDPRVATLMAMPRATAATANMTTSGNKNLTISAAGTSLYL